MVIVVIIVGVFFLILSFLVFIKPQTIINLVTRAEIKWTVDKELFKNSKIVRTAVGIVFILAAVVLLWAGYSIAR